nr:5453_t:CDS:2 [Entrophospora candida]
MKEDIKWQELSRHPIYKAKAIGDYKSTHPMDISFDNGDIIEVLKLDNDEWWSGCLTKSKDFGVFPKKKVKIVEEYHHSQDDKNNSKVEKVINKAIGKLSLFGSNNGDSSESEHHIDSSNGKEQRGAAVGGERTVGGKVDPLSKCSFIVTKDFKGHHLDLSAAKKSDESSITKLSEYLTSTLNDDPLYKLRAIFIWITDNIVYDTKAFFSGQISCQDGQDILKSRKAVCEGYSELFKDLANAAGLEVSKISGVAKGAGYNPGSDVGREHDHSWNCVNYKGEFLLIDSTWGAGVLNGPDFEKKFDDFFFLTSPIEFIYTHFPNDPDHQYLQPAITKSEYIHLPFVKSEFFKYGLKFEQFYGDKIVVKDDVMHFDLEQTKQRNKSISFIVNLEWKKKKEKGLYQRLHMIGKYGGALHRFNFGCPSHGEGILSVFLVPEGQNRGEITMTLNVENHGKGKNYYEFLKTYKAPFEATIIQPLSKELCYNKKTRFEMIAYDKNDCDGGSIPNLYVCSDEFKTQVKLERSSPPNRVEKGAVYYSADVTLNHKGTWSIVFEPEKNNFGFFAEYEVK